jgi:hypothetical protein
MAMIVSDPSLRCQYHLRMTMLIVRHIMSETQLGSIWRLATDRSMVT